MKAFLSDYYVGKLRFADFSVLGEGWVTRNSDNARPIPLQVFVRRKCSAKSFSVSVLFTASMIAVKPVSPCFCVDLLKFL